MPLKYTIFVKFENEELTLFLLTNAPFSILLCNSKVFTTFIISYKFFGRGIRCDITRGGSIFSRAAVLFDSRTTFSSSMSALGRIGNSRRRDIRNTTLHCQDKG